MAANTENVGNADLAGNRGSKNVFAVSTKRRRYGLFALCFALTLCGVRANGALGGQDNKDQHQDVTRIKEAISKANGAFSTTLYKELMEKETGNIFYSPMSIHAIMYMTAGGAALGTFDEMISALQLRNAEFSLEAYDTYLSEVYNKKNDSLKMTAAIFVDSSFCVRDDFATNCTEHFNSRVKNLDFKNNAETQRLYMNKWVSDETKNTINDLFPSGSVDEYTTLVLANAVHFESDWMYQFGDGANETFYESSGAEKIVRMMTVKNRFRYYSDESLKFAALELPYQNRAYSMVILLPNDKRGLKNIEQHLSEIDLRDLVKFKMQESPMDVKMPHFKMERSLSLKDTLTKLGCKTMFTPAADFSKITEANNLYVRDFVHKAYIGVDKKSTMAGAASAVSQRMSRSLPPVYTEFTVDHPFIFYILNESSNVIFLGRMINIE